MQQILLKTTGQTLHINTLYLQDVTTKIGRMVTVQVKWSELYS